MEAPSHLATEKMRKASVETVSVEYTAANPLHNREPTIGMQWQFQLKALDKPVRFQFKCYFWRSVASPCRLIPPCHPQGLRSPKAMYHFTAKMHRTCGICGMLHAKPVILNSVLAQNGTMMVFWGKFMRIPSFYCLYPLVWRVSEEASDDNVTSSCSRMAEWGLWLYLIEFDHQVAEGVDKDTEDEEEPQLSLAFQNPVELIASLFQVQKFIIWEGT